MKTLQILIVALIIPINIIFARNDNDIKKGEKINTTFTIEGKVIDQQTGEPLTGVKIEIPGIAIVSYTDFEGNFTIKNVKPGNYNVETSLISYEQKSEKINITIESLDRIKIELETVN